jgi:hypothetical protein
MFQIKVAGINEICILYHAWLSVLARLQPEVANKKSVIHIRHVGPVSARNRSRTL